MKRFFFFALTIPIVSLLQVLLAQEGKDKISELSELGPQIKEMMQVHKLSGLSMAILENDKIIWSDSYGVKENGKEQKITKETAFSTASISKAVTATVCLLLQEQGKIDIDKPVRKYLKRWKLPNSSFLQKTDLTIRHLLSHTGGVSHGGYADFYGEDTVPDIVQVLNGVLLPNHDKGIEILFEPGTEAKYSGGGYVIVQMAIEDILGRPFQSIVKEMIFDSLQMEHSTMLQPNQKDFPTDVAKVHDVSQNVIRTGLPICPQLGPSGMWSSAKDLAKFALEMQKALNNKNTKVISPAVAKALTEIVSYSYSGGGALGWQRSFAYGNLEWVTIAGSNAGVGGEINISYKGGKGIVLLANGETINRLPIFNFIRTEVINRLGWGQELQETHPLNDEEFITAIQGSYLDFMFGDFSETVTITNNKRNLSIASPVLKLLTGSSTNMLYHQGNYIFKVTDYPNYIQFNYNGTTLDSVSIYRDNAALEKWTVPISDLKTMQVRLMEVFSIPDFQIAKEQYQELLKKTPQYDFSNSILQVGVSFFSRGEIERSLQLFEYNSQQHPKNPDSYLALAEVHERLGRLKVAIAYYQDALEIIKDEKTKSAIIAKIQTLKKTKS